MVCLPRCLQPEWELERDFTETWQFSRPVWDWRPNNGLSVVGGATPLVPLLRRCILTPCWNFRILRSLLELCLSSQRDIESIDFFSLALSVCLFSWFTEDGWRTWLGTHTGCVLQDNNTLEQGSRHFSMKVTSFMRQAHKCVALSFFGQYCTSEKSVTVLWAQVKKEKEGSYIEGIGARRTPWKG